MSEFQDHFPEPPDQKEVTVEALSFIDRHAIHPLVFVFASLVIVFLLYQIGGGILTFVVTGAASITRENVWAMRWLTIIGQLCFILLPTLLLARLFAVRLSLAFPFRVPGIRESLLALIALFSLQRVFEAYMFFQDMVPLPKLLQVLLDPLKKLIEEVMKELVRADSQAELLFVIVVVAVVPAIVEELFFRGFIQKVLERLMSPLVAAILAGTLFGLYHMNPFEIIPLIGLGVFFGLLRYRSQSLLLPIAAHFFNNLMAVLAFYYGLQDENLFAATQTTIDISTMMFELIVFAILFVLTFIAYLRMTKDISRQTRKEEF
jgi:uncharacterized protein